MEEQSSICSVNDSLRHKAMVHSSTIIKMPKEPLFTREDVVRVKPDPALYSLAVNALGVLPADAVAIEDSRNGMLAAKAAGLKCVVAPNEITQQSVFPEADLHMTTLADRPLEEWLKEL